MMQNYIDILRQLNYELVKELGLFKHRAGLSFSQRHILYHIKNNISLSIQELADFLHVEHSTMSRNIKKLVQAGLVDIYQDEKDKRRKVITLSAAGESRLAEAPPNAPRASLFTPGGLPYTEGTGVICRVP